MLQRLVSAGMDCARLNCSHGAREDLLRRTAAVREAAEAPRAIALLFDLQGPKLRLSGATETRALRGRRDAHLRRHWRCRAPTAWCRLRRIRPLVDRALQIVIGDGVPRLPSTASPQDEVVARVVSPGPLSARKGVNVTYARPELPAITEKDLADLATAVEADADFVALSFVRSAADMEQLKAHMALARLCAAA